MLTGLNCCRCPGGGPYITAYEIAVKNGFKGTEKEWLESLQSVYVARVTERAGQIWSCSDSYENLVLMSQNKEVHLQTLDGKTAFLDGIDGEKITFRTQNYAADEGTVYDRYALYRTGGGEYEVVDVSTETGTITIDRLASGIQTSLGKADTAYQKPESGVPKNDLASDVQATLGKSDTIYPMFYEPGGDIWLYDLKQDVQQSIFKADNSLQPGDLYEGVVTMEDHGVELIASKTSSEIAEALAAGVKIITLIDYAGRQCILIAPPRLNQGGYTDAKFWTYDALNAQNVLYYINSSGIVSQY